MLRTFFVMVALLALAMTTARAWPPPFMTPLGGGISAPTPTPTPLPTTVPFVLQSMVFVGNGSGGAAGADAGAADAQLFYGMEPSGVPTPNPNCAGYATSSCEVYYYNDLSFNQCVSGYETDFLTWANANDENAYFHNFDFPRDAADRYMPTSTSSCSPTYGGDTSHRFFMNLTDTVAANWVYANLVDSTLYHALKDRGVWQDDFSMAGGIDATHCPTSGVGSLCSEEYGQPAQAWLAPTGTHTPSPSVNAIAGYANYPNHLCQTWCAPVVINGWVGETCGTVSAGHCFGSFGAAFPHSARTYDNQLRIAELCSALTNSNFHGFVAERAVNNGTFLASYRWTNLLNTAADLINNHQNSDNCRNMRIIDLEQPSTTTVRSYTWALHWLFPDANGIPTMYIPMRYTLGQVATETAFFPEDELVPYGPEQPLLGNPYHFNGTALTDGTGCASSGRDADTGGAPSLIVYCSAGTAIYCEQYQHLQYAQSGTAVDLGKAMACVNPSANDVLFSGMAFHGDPFSTYHSTITYSGGEVANSATLWYAPGLSGHSGCTSVTNCTGALVFGGAIPATLPADSGMILSAATPTPTPTPTPPPSLAYMFPPTGMYAVVTKQCQVWPLNDWFTFDFTAGNTSTYLPFTFDANSASYISALEGAFPHSITEWYSKEEKAIINIAQNTPPFFSGTFTGTGAGFEDATGVDTAHTSPHQNAVGSVYQEDGTACTSISGDCAFADINLDTCIEYEMYTFNADNWPSGNAAYHTTAFTVNNLNQKFPNKGANISNGNTPWLGLVDTGEDAAGAATCNDDGTGAGCIHHAVAWNYPIPGDDEGGGIAPATGRTVSCSINCTWPLPLNAHLILKSAVAGDSGCTFSTTCTCPSRVTFPQSHLVCVQMQHYGLFLQDQQQGKAGESCGTGAQTYNYCLSGIRFSLRADGTHGWNMSGDLIPGWIGGQSHPVSPLPKFAWSDFKVVKLCGGTIIRNAVSQAAPSCP